MLETLRPCRVLFSPPTSFSVSLWANSPVTTHVELAITKTIKAKRSMKLNRRCSGKRTNSKTQVTRKKSTANFPKNEHFLPHDTHTCVSVSGGKKRLFFGKLGVLCFFVTFILRFTLLPYHRRNVITIMKLSNTQNKR